MIWYWLRKAFARVAWLFRPPAPRDIAHIDPHSPCPVCGARAGMARCVDRLGQILVQRTCGVCGARWHLEPVVKTDNQRIWPAVARTEQESRESQPPISITVTGKPVTTTRGGGVQ